MGNPRIKILLVIAKAVHAGNNEIEIRIKNTWWNRLVSNRL
jgi:hypothetical protein